MRRLEAAPDKVLMLDRSLCFINPFSAVHNPFNGLPPNSRRMPVRSIAGVGGQPGM